MTHQNRKVLLVGGAGYIGTIVTEKLLNEGFQVVCADNLIYKNHSTVWPFLSKPGYTFERWDMTSGAKWKSDNVTDVVILAGLVGDPITKKYPNESEAINLKGVRQTIELANSCKTVSKMVFVSTCSNYGLAEGDAMVDENSPLNPLSLYAKHKVENEKYLLEKQWNFSPTVLRFATAFGLSPRMRFDLTVNEFTREMALQKPLLVYDPDTWRPYCHVKDFAGAVHKVLVSSEKSTHHQVYNVGSDANNYTKRGIVELISQYVKCEISYKQHGSDPRNYKVNFAKLREGLGYIPEYSVEAGVKEILAAFHGGLFENVDEQKWFFGNYEIFNKK